MTQVNELDFTAELKDLFEIQGATVKARFGITQDPDSFAQ